MSNIDDISKTVGFNVPVAALLTTLKKYYDMGLSEQEVKLNINFTRDDSQFKLLQDYVIKNIKSLDVETQESLRKQITQGVFNKESITELKQRVQKVLDTTVERAKMIARTESNRAYNMGHLNAARQSGLKLKKQWVSAMDSRTSEICRCLDGQIVDMNEKFKCEHGEWDAPPAHVNCRARVIFIQEEKKDE